MTTSDDIHDAILFANDAMSSLAKLIENLKRLQPATPFKRLPVPWIAQNDPMSTTDDFTNSDCGPACVAMILRWLSHNVTVDDVSKATGLPAGFKYTTATNLIKAATSFGLSLVHQFGEASDPIGPLSLALIRSEIDRGYPVIALVNYPSLPIRSDMSFKGGHFIVIIGYDPDGGDLFYNDPYWRDNTGAGIRITGLALSSALANCSINGNRPFQGLTVKP